ncbi:transcription antitermination factor NusB [Corynebacterium alimapuense]|uniref:Transcription antitermination protein NusB n=1 Tax=Corynebacterium alimapuense TaxID=1576874 RepID=A0A3M8K7W3_9CORY|nr:transcription antitermination factor NusB [Corynebacterium alimapuense]RNE49236.1 transcription antitermination factor NusB [Corynebacterium alimapuense]
MSENSQHPDTEAAEATQASARTEDKYWRRHGARYRARRRAVDILFEAEARDIDPVAVVEDRISLSTQRDAAVAPVADYTRVIIAGAAAELDGIDEMIERFLATDWELYRLPAVDRAILRVAVWEILHNPEVDSAVAVVEGVELASQYGNDVASPYIHAVLDDVAQTLAADNPMSGSSLDDADSDEDADSLEESTQTS